ncbi:hypothetical protein SBV45_03520 [Chlamydia crocodili]
MTEREPLGIEGSLLKYDAIPIETKKIPKHKLKSRQGRNAK